MKCYYVNSSIYFIKKKKVERNEVKYKLIFKKRVIDILNRNYLR